MAKKRKYTKSNSRGNTRKSKRMSNIDLTICILIVLSILLGFLIYTNSGVIGVKLNEILGGMMGVTRLLLPIGMALGIDPIHLGVIMVVNMEIGMLTPPVGLNLFVASGITGLSLKEVIVASLPMTGILLIGLMLVTYIPAISLWLPRLMYG